GADAQRRRAFAGGADHDGAFAALGPELVFDECADFAVAFADHGDDRDVGRVVARHGAEQGALADAAAAENADALAFAAGQQGIDGADAGDQHLGNVLAVEGIGGGAVEAIGFARFYGWTVVHRFAEAIDDTAEQSRTHVDAGILAARRQGIAQLQAVNLLQRHGQHVAVAETDDLGANRPAVRGAHFAEIANGDVGAARLHQQAD